MHTCNGLSVTVCNGINPCVFMYVYMYVYVCDCMRMRTCACICNYTNAPVHMFDIYIYIYIYIESYQLQTMEIEQARAHAHTRTLHASWSVTGSKSRDRQFGQCCSSAVLIAVLCRIWPPDAMNHWPRTNQYSIFSIISRMVILVAMTIG